MDVKSLEIQIWEAAKNRDKKAYLEVVNGDAVMVCGGFRCTGAEYADIISEFDCKEYQMEHFEIVCETREVVQVHYVITTKVNEECNKDLEGSFHVTSTWKKTEDKWKLVFNMDQRIMFEQ